MGCHAKMVRRDHKQVTDNLDLMDYYQVCLMSEMMPAASNVSEPPKL